MMDDLFRSLREAQAALALHTRQEKDRALHGVIAAIGAARRAILDANAADTARARADGMTDALLDRLRLDEAGLDAIVEGVAAIARQDDPIGRVTAGWTLPNGLLVERVTVPLGVAAIIYESRPNVTADAAALAYKAGCAILLRGSQAARESNRALAAAIKRGLAEAGGVPGAVELAASESRDEIDAIIGARGKIDAVIPRGGRALIRRVADNARVPVIETGEGNCHIFVDASADIPSAAAIIANAKLQKPGACNAAETVLVHKDALADLMPLLARTLAGKAEMRCDARTKAAIGVPPEGLVLTDATDADWETEFLDYILAVKAVDSLDEAIAHIARFGTRHSEAIMTQSLPAAEAFTRRVDAACVYTNASTRFTDGGEFGFGAELGISTQKFHARGPMGIDALTTVKYRVSGNGQVR